jgi:ssDNA-binding Zn-finger/Zn-ribbon topoisomerase 1
MLEVVIDKLENYCDRKIKAIEEEIKRTEIKNAILKECKYCGELMDLIYLYNDLDKPVYILEYECPNCGAYLDINGDWREGD